VDEFLPEIGNSALICARVLAKIARTASSVGTENNVFRVRMEELFGPLLRLDRRTDSAESLGGLRCHEGTAPVTPPNVIRGLRSARLDQAENDKGDNALKLKGKVLAGAGALAMAGGLVGVAAPAAHASVVLTPVVINTTSGPQTVGSCQNSVQLVKLSTPVKGQGLGDQTRDNVKAAGALAKDQSTKLVVNGGGTCSGVTPHGDKHIPFPTNDSQGESNLTPKAAAVSLLGNASCAQDAPASPGPATFDKENDATANNAYPLQGKITWTFNETYNNLTTGLPSPYKMQADVTVIGFSTNPATPDVINIGGTVLTGVNAGAKVSGSVWFDPVLKDGGSGGYNTGYDIDLASAVGCQDDASAGLPPSDPSVNDANLTTVLSGSGSTTPSILGSVVPGLSFSFGG
jgi:hypothetical protein